MTMRPGKGKNQVQVNLQMSEIVAGQLDAANTTSIEHDVGHVNRTHIAKFMSILHGTTKV